MKTRVPYKTIFRSPSQYRERGGVVITGGRGGGSEQVGGHEEAIRAGESGAQAGAGYGFINAARIHSRDGGYVRSDLRAAQADARRIRRLPARPCVDQDAARFGGAAAGVRDRKSVV